MGALEIKSTKITEREKLRKKPLKVVYELLNSSELCIHRYELQDRNTSNSQTGPLAGAHKRQIQTILQKLKKLN